MIFGYQPAFINTIKRWASIGSCISIAIMFVLFALSVWESTTEISTRISRIHPSLLCGTVIVGFAMLLSWWIWSCRFTQLRTVVWYPAIWLAIAVAGLVSVITDLVVGVPLEGTILGDFGWMVVNTDWWAWLLSAFMFLLSGISLWMNWKGEPRSLGLPDPDISFNSLVKWFSDDREVGHPDDDLFKHRVIAERIAGRLMVEGKDAPTIALFGPQGSGKSTIRNFVEYELRFRRNDRVRVVMVPVSMWQYSSPQAAVAGILGSLLDALNAHGPNLAAAGVPKRFMTAASGIGPWSGIMSALVHDSEPKDVINRLEALVNDLGVRIVLWVEDLERYAWSDPRIGRMREIEEERVGPIRSLLYLLDRAEGISVVHSDTSLRNRFDTEKLARYRERVPTLEAEYVWNQFERLRKQMKADLNERGYEDPIDPSDRKPLDLPSEFGMLIPSNRSIRVGGQSLPESLSLLCQNPRKLKVVLRMIWERWKVLCGEIDFDSLILVCALAESDPDIFDVINENYDGFKNGLRPDNSLPGSQREEHPARAEYNTVLEKAEKLHGKEYRKAIKRCVDHLFPKNDQNQSEYRDQSELHNPQSLTIDICWERFNSGATGTLDQGVIREIRSWQSGNTEALVQRMVEGDDGGHTERFGRLLSFEDVTRLFRETVDELAEVPVDKWIRRDRYDSLVCMPIFIRMLGSKPYQSDLITNNLREIIDELVNKNLPLLHEVMYWFDSRPNNPISLQTLETFESLNLYMLERVASKYSELTAADLNRALMGGSPYVLQWLYRLVGSELLPLEQVVELPGWKRIAELLIDLAEESPSIGIAQILPFVTDKGNRKHQRTSEQNAYFKPDDARLLFADFDALLAPFKNAPKSLGQHFQEMYGDEFRDRWRAARLYAEEHSDHADSPDSSESNETGE